MKNVEVTVKVSWDYDKTGDVTQIFDFENKPWINNPGYILHKKFEEKIVENSLFYLKNVTCMDMIRGDSQILIKYKVGSDFDYERLKPRFYKVASAVPDNEGCRFCSYYRKKNDYGICEFQDGKEIFNPLKRCKFFRQLKGIVT